MKLGAKENKVENDSKLALRIVAVLMPLEDLASRGLLYISKDAFACLP